MALVVCTWFWGAKFGPEYVERLRAGVARNLNQEYRFEVFQPWPQDEHLTAIPGCFCRLRMFSRAFHDLHGINEGDRLVCIDLDTVITGPLDPLFDRPEPFVIMQGGNVSNPCPYNGALTMLRAGYRPDVWSDFSIEAAGKVPFFEFPDDQGWLHYKIPDAAGWKCGTETGVYVFQKPGWPGGDVPPNGARLVTFNGRRSPAQYTHLNWVRENWR